MTPTLFQQVLGVPYYTLPDSVRALHAIRGEARYAGLVSVARGRGLLARLCAAAARLPRSMTDAPLAVTFLATARNANATAATHSWSRRRCRWPGR